MFKMGVNDDCVYKSNLTLNIFQEIFIKNEPDVKIDSFEEEQGSSRGDNYTSALYRINLKGHKKSENDVKKLKWEKSVICKRLPDSRERREAYRSEELFHNEVIFYNEIIPALLSFQKLKTNETFNAVPKCYLAQSDLLMLEDLRVREFQMPDRRVGLSLKQTETVLVELAKFHSLSLAYRSEFPIQFDKLKRKISEGIFSVKNTKWYEGYYKKLTKNTVSMVSKSLPKNSKYIEKMKNFIDSNTFFNQMIELVTTEGPLSVICHGDCWTNNLLYKYDDDGNILEIQFVDFQLIRFGSLTLDLSNLLFCCTDKELRRDHFKPLLRIYHKELVRSLKLFGEIPNFCGNEEELWNKIENDFKFYGKFGLGLALDIVPISTCLSEEAPDLYNTKSEEITEAPDLDVIPNDLCEEKMTDIVVDMVDFGWL